MSSVSVLFCIAFLFVGSCLKPIVIGLAVHFVLKSVCVVVGGLKLIIQLQTHCLSRVLSLSI